MLLSGRWRSLFCALVYLLASGGRALESDGARTSPQASPPQPPSPWIGAAWLDDESGRSRRLRVTAARTGSPPRTVATEPPSRRAPGSLEVTDLAYDATQQLAYVGVCCEPGSGQLLRVDLKAAPPAFTHDDQGDAVDVAGASSVFARADTWGTFAVRTRAGVPPELREAGGVSDVAVDAGPPARVLALIDSKRLRALVPTIPAPPDSSPDPALLVRTWDASGRSTDATYPLPADRTYCRIVPLPDGAVGLLAGTVDSERPWRCLGTTLDVYDVARGQRREGVLTFPDRIQHVSIDESSTYLIFTTVAGAVGWRTLDGRGGRLAPRGFAAADW